MSNKTILKARGTAKFPWLNRPDTKFNLEGDFKVDVVLTPDEAQPLIDRLEAMQAEALKEAQAKKKGKRVKQADLPIQPELDEDGEETGNFVLRTKMKASGVSKKTGKPWSRKLPLFDAQGTPTNVRVGGGSEIIVAFEPSAYDSSSVGVGVTLRMEAVQVITLREGGGASSSSFGFGSVEGGFVASDEDNAGEPDTEAPQAEDEDGYDF